MGSISQSIGGGVLPATSRHAHMGVAPASETDINTLGDAGIIYAGHQIDITLYVEAQTAPVTAVLYGRVKLRNPPDEIVGAWNAMKTITVAAGLSVWEQVALADLASGPNQFKIAWSGSGSGANSKVILTLS